MASVAQAALVVSVGLAALAVSVAQEVSAAQAVSPLSLLTVAASSEAAAATGHTIQSTAVVRHMRTGQRRTGLEAMHAVIRLRNARRAPVKG